ncbi:MAG: hypothetical protein COV71_05115 [Candidatus Omnitrophica bacterium CG11_big_fil_rev_8_21_14_0_20_41_12]|jgi:hypothetical protein|nr:MAG: hypothetical protein COV71_05115 [Candidatus Omnitrophica bacterium CG11_big_fil_rev_8_21_14_0_20_41_12]
MKVLQGILSESKEYYLDVKKKIEKRLLNLPVGSIKEREISGKRYYYLQFRKDKKVIQKYLGKNNPEAIIRQIRERNVLKRELKKVNEALKIVKRSEGKKRG